MRLLEFQAKRLFAQQGIPVPQGRLVTSPEEVETLPLPVVLKAQVPVGGRGKAGGIRVVETLAEARVAFADLMKMTIKGYPVCAVLAEERVEVDRELYLALLYHPQTHRPMIMASARGGMDIEQTARENPEAIFRQELDLAMGLPAWTTGYLAKRLGVKDKAGLRAITETLYAILLEQDATLVEINPLGENCSGLQVMDGKVILDDRTSFRHEEFFRQLQAEKAAYEQPQRLLVEKMALENEITYVPLGGDIAVISDGAGTGMLTVDMIQDMGGAAANFCEMGGKSDAEVMEKSMGVVLANPHARVLLITLIGGMTRMDDMAEGIARYLRKHDVAVPIVIRLCGTQEQAGREILRGVGIEAFEDLAQAVGSAVQISKAKEPCQS